MYVAAPGICMFNCVHNGWDVCAGDLLVCVFSFCRVYFFFLHKRVVLKPLCDKPGGGSASSGKALDL